MYPVLPMVLAESIVRERALKPRRRSAWTDRHSWMSPRAGRRRRVLSPTTNAR